MSEAQKVTYFEKKQTVCPVCETKFTREDLLSGGGRLIAGQLTEELRRLYEPSKKFGEVCPLIYSVTVCPACCFAAFHPDFTRLPPGRVQEVDSSADQRREAISPIFPELDFTNPRTLREGAASYFLAIACYDFFDKGVNPTFKAGLASLRAAWIFSDLHAHAPKENWDQLSRMFYRKARFYYLLTLRKEQGAKEPLADGLQLGPDLDKNYGYDGLIYLAGYLDYKYGADPDAEKRVASLEAAKRTIAKVFGMGRASKSKPSALLDMSKAIYAKIGEEIATLKGEEPPPADE
jgi:uncharacterized protein